ncbi:tyrosine-type recombinase/integrase [Enterococcus sp. AZ196]|uniref:tyrosine-type recombinase/integrase n=1 Tax=Enterococcus sp. AZ196 TaxID=2774659 RepID=UPI003D2D5D90
MSTIKKYKKKNGSTAYMFKKYLGIDPLTGKQIETTRRGFSSIRQARTAYARLSITDTENISKSSSKNRTYKELFEEWFVLIYKNRVKESTYWNTHLVFEKHILPEIGNYRIQNISVTNCQKHANKWANLSPNRYYRFINYASMIFKYAISIDEISSNPMENIVMPVPQDNIKEFERLNFYNRNELLQFLNILKLEFPLKRYVFFSLLAYTGMRKGEALALTWSDIDMKNRALTISKTLAVGKNGKLLIQKPKTKASNRKISLDIDTVKLLNIWEVEQRNENRKLNYSLNDKKQLVFSNESNNSLMNPRAPQTWLATLYKHHKDLQKITPHGFRHTHASLLFDAGATMKQVQSRLGHSNIKTTMNVYTHVTEESREETALIFNDYMKNGKSLGQSLGQKKNPA